jgi:hypothetical protein
MKQYTKKPVTISAVQYKDEMRVNDNLPEGVVIQFWPENKFVAEGDYPTINTLEGPHIVTDGDYIITGVAGEKYPCRADIFEQTYSEFNPEAMTFGQAVEAAKQGKFVARVGWNGAGMFAFIKDNEGQYETIDYPHGGFDNLPKRPSWYLKTAQGDVATWSPSGSDSLAEDWMIVE